MVESLADSLNKEEETKDAASILYVLAGTLALDSKEALNSLCMHNVIWADQTLKAIRHSQKDGGTPPPDPPSGKIILPGEE